MAFAFRRVLDLFVFVWLFHLSYLTYGVVPNSGIQQLAVSGLAKMAFRHLMVEYPWKGVFFPVELLPKKCLSLVTLIGCMARFSAEKLRKLDKHFTSTPVKPVLFDIKIIKIIWSSLFVIKLSVCLKCYCNNVILKEPSRPHFSFLALACYPCDFEENKKGKSEALLQEGGKWCGNHNNQGISMSWSC